MPGFENALEKALEWAQAGEHVALATVIETWSSAPRRVGAQMAVAGTGEMAGSISGGCVERAVVAKAQHCKHPEILEFVVTDDDAITAGFACGGAIRILLEPIGENGMPQNMLRDLVAARAARQPIAYEIALHGPERGVVMSGHDDLFRRDMSALSEDGTHFVAISNPPLRLVVVGAVHIAQALVPMARIAGFTPIIIDPREAFASASRFPDTQLVNEWPDQAVDAIGLDERTAVVLLSHEPKLDDPVLHSTLNSKAFYIGALGSRRTHAARIARLEAAGFSAAQIGRVAGPAGLDIGSANPAEIAVSILGQMIERLRKPND